MKYYRVAVNYPIGSGVLNYSSELDIPQGSLVKVPLRQREEFGCVLGIDKDFSLENQKYKIKSIISVEEEFALSSNEIKLYEWMASYYHYSLGKLIFDCLPKRMKRPRQVPIVHGSNPQAIELTSEQDGIFQNINAQLSSGFNQHLIHGITGSGKSLIYLNLMKEVVKKSESILFLLPEINLTPQFMKMFEAYLDVPVYQYHSSVTNSEKYNLWKRLKESDDPCVIVGVRSSLFLPISKLGLIVVDEEHDSSFKQDDRCAYQGRDVAIYKALIHQATIVLGSATPSVESYHRFKSSDNPKLNYHSLKVRYGDGRLPKIVISDLKNNGEDEFFTPTSLKLLDEAIESGEQALIFVNRLGFAHYYQCNNCGHHYECPNCAVNLKIYRKRNKMLCHHCDYEKPIPKQCDECGGLSFYHKGFGTEQVELKLRELRPYIKFDRFDRDEVKNFKDLKKKLEDFASGEFEVLIGTQMLSKGHNFEKVNLVLVLGIDNQLNFPDFRANERVYQLVNQIAGRSGRFSDKGRVVIETLSEKNPLWNHLSEDSDEFFETEISVRGMCECPPFYKLAAIYFTSNHQDKLISYVSSLSPMMNGVQKQIKDTVVLGPKPAPIEKRVNKFTWLYLIKAKDSKSLNRFIESAKNHFGKANGISIKIDVDPANFI